MPERTRGLSSAAAHAERFLQTLDERPVAARVGRLGDPRGARRATARAGGGSGGGDRRPGRGRRCRDRRFGRSAAFRLRHRWRAAGRAGRRLAGLRMGPVRGLSLTLSRGRRDRGDCGAVDARPPRPPGERERRLRHGWAGREHDRPGGGPPCCARARRLGRGARRSRWRAARERDLRRTGPRHDLHRAAAARLRRGERHPDPSRRPGTHATPWRCRRRLPASTGRRLSARRRATWPPAPSTPSSRSRTHVPPTARGCTSMAPSGCGRRRPRPLASCCAVRSAPTRGLSTRTSGSTSPTTARWPSSPTRTPIAPRWASPLHISSQIPRSETPTNYVPESSRRARAVPVYAALRSLGRSGVAALVERNCAHARRMAAHLAEIPGAEILNDVVLNQVLVRFPGGDEANRAAVAAVQSDGTCWLGGTQWQGRAVMRVSFSNWATSDADVDRSAAAIAAAVS